MNDGEEDEESPADNFDSMMRKSVGGDKRGSVSTPGSGASSKNIPRRTTFTGKEETSKS